MLNRLFLCFPRTLPTQFLVCIALVLLVFFSFCDLCGSFFFFFSFFFPFFFFNWLENITLFSMSVQLSLHLLSPQLARCRLLYLVQLPKKKKTTTKRRNRRRKKEQKGRERKRHTMLLCVTSSVSPPLCVKAS